MFFTSFDSLTELFFPQNSLGWLHDSIDFLNMEKKMIQLGKN